MVMVNISHYVDEKILENEGRWKVLLQQIFHPFSPNIFIDNDIFNSSLFSGFRKSTGSTTSRGAYFHCG